MDILSVRAAETLDSRGFPALTARIGSDIGVFYASVPSGASVGAHEAVELRDGEPRLMGKGVKKAAVNVNTVIAEKILEKQPRTQSEIDELLIGCDSTVNKSVIGANAMLAVSMAAARLFSAAKGIPLYQSFGSEVLLPCPMMNILNGGAHADNNLDIQEFMVMPVGAASFREAMDMGMEVYMSLRALLKKRGLSTAVGDEGGFAPSLAGDEQALELLLSAVEKAGLSPSRDIALAIDAAASEWYSSGVYAQPKSKKSFAKGELLSYYQRLARNYPLISIEDGFAEDDLDGFSELTRALPIQIVGDDLFVTNTMRIAEGIKRGAANAVLIKPNQIGTVSETLLAIRLAQKSGYAAIVSHRSGDTEDAFIAELAVGTGCGQIKTGAPCRGERTAKYSRLLLIEDELKEKAHFAGKSRVK